MFLIQFIDLFNSYHFEEEKTLQDFNNNSKWFLRTLSNLNNIDDRHLTTQEEFLVTARFQDIERKKLQWKSNN